MRHFLHSGAVTALPLGMGEPSTTGVLVTTPRIP